MFSGIIMQEGDEMRVCVRVQGTHTRRECRQQSLRHGPPDLPRGSLSLPRLSV